MKKMIMTAPLMIAVLALVLFSTASTAVSQPLTSQIWAVSVEADPGHTGSIGMNFEAAYGVPGAHDVGDYFYIDQHAYTSSGVTGRYIDVSSPISGGYLSEDMLLVGMADIKESFSMMNRPARSSVAAGLGWLKTFNKR